MKIENFRMLLCTDLTTELKIENLSQNAGRISNSVPKYLTRNLLVPLPFLFSSLHFPFLTFLLPVAPAAQVYFSPSPSPFSPPERDQRRGRVLEARSQSRGQIAARPRPRGEIAARGPQPRRYNAATPPGCDLAARTRHLAAIWPRLLASAVTPPAILRGAATGLCFYIIQKFFYNL